MIFILLWTLTTPHTAAVRLEAGVFVCVDIPGELMEVAERFVTSHLI